MKLVQRVFALCAAMASVAMACESAMSLIEQAEGYNPCMYHDTRGIPTICYGFNLENSDAPQLIDGLGANYQEVLAGKQCLTQSDCTSLLQTEVNVAAQGAEEVFGNQCQCVQAVLTDMTYNLGEGGISTFTTFISEIEAHEWSKASNDLYGTLWCSQVGSRCSRDAGIIAQGCGGGPGSDDAPPPPHHTTTHKTPTTHHTTTHKTPTTSHHNTTSTGTHTHTGTHTGTHTSSHHTTPTTHHSTPTTHHTSPTTHHSTPTTHHSTPTTHHSTPTTTGGSHGGSSGGGSSGGGSSGGGTSSRRHLRG